MEQHTVPPSSLETERAVIGMMLCFPDCRAKVKVSVPQEAFYSETHGLIYNAIFACNGGDTLTVINRLRRDNKLEQVGGMESVFQLAMDVSTTATIKHHMAELVDLYKQRLVMQTCHEAFQGISTGFTANEVISDIRGKLRGIESKGNIDKPASNKEMLKRVWDDIEQRVDSGKREVGVLTGYEVIDKNLMGLEPKSLIYLIARPSVGKTALALNIADNISNDGVGLALVFSLEMGGEALTRRSLAAETDVYLSRIRSGNLEQRHLDKILVGMSRLQDRDIFTLDHPRWKTVEMLTGMAEKISSEKKIAAIFVDHIQLMRSSEKFNNRHLELSHISNELKSLAKSLDIPVVALSQLNRAIENRRDKKPQLQDMKESGDLEQDADVVLGLYREDKESEVMEVCCLKGRDVGLWRGALHFNRFTQKISN